MRRMRDSAYGLVRISRFPLSLFAVIFGGLLAASGVHVGLILLVQALTRSEMVLVHVVLLYWALVSLRPRDRWPRGTSRSTSRRTTPPTSWTIWTR